MRGRWCMTEPPEVRAELADLGVLTADYQRPLMHADECVACRMGRGVRKDGLATVDHTGTYFRHDLHCPHWASFFGHREVR
jgi:hypothetical protein